MSKNLRTLRSQHLRLLASLLVMLAILCNGISLAQAHVMEAEKDCCAEMMGEKMSPDKPCPVPENDCDDQCMARCMTANGVLLSVPLTITSSVFIATPLPRFNMTQHSLAELAPGLRPPIYS